MDKDLIINRCTCLCNINPLSIWSKKAKLTDFYSCQFWRCHTGVTLESLRLVSHTLYPLW